MLSQTMPSFFPLLLSLPHQSLIFLSLGSAFLAAMSSSRSDVVTKSVCSCVRPSLFFLLVSLKFLLVLKSFNGVSRLFKGYLEFKGSIKDVLRKFYGCLQKVTEFFKGDSKEPQGI